MNPIKVYLLFLCFLVTFGSAQTTPDLVGSWQAQAGDVIATTTILADGTYTFEIPSQNYYEQGTWQFDGTNFSQQWTDTNTGAAMNETYLVEFLDANSFRQSGGNLQGQVYTFVRTNARAAPAQAVISSPDLVGTWQAPFEDTIVTQTIQADGTYTFQNPESDNYEAYFEEGTWQFDGVNYSQQYQDPNTGESLDETYTVEFLDANTFRQYGGNLGATVYTFTRVAAESASTPSPTPEQTATNPVSTPATQTTPSPTPEQLAAQGINPESMLIPDVFHCYEERESDDFSQYDFELTILPGNRYSTPFGDGEYRMEDESSILEVTWLSGPLSENADYAFGGYDEYGQDLGLADIGVDELDYSCFQRGIKDEQMRLELAFKNAQPGVYSCIEEDTGSAGPTLEILGNGLYRVDGVEGEYAVDLMSDPEDDLPSIDYLSGLWGEGYGFISSDEETGMREISVSTDEYGDFDCSMLGAPFEGIKYGAAAAAPPPPGAGGLEGLYAMWQPDVLGYCGGLCWSFYYFFPNGYVYTEEPDGPLEEIDCTRTKPNGEPVCDVYTLQGNSIIFRDGVPKPFAQTSDGLSIDEGNYNKIWPVGDIKLDGEFRAFSYIAAVGGQGGTAIEKTFTFYPDGTFTRDGFVGASFSTTDTGTSLGTPTAGVTVSSESSNSGTYQIQGNTLILNFNDRQVVKEFFFVMPGEDPNNPEGLHLGSSDYTLQ
jgi:hypothetical protein